jgi:hypothetical protein
MIAPPTAPRPAELCASASAKRIVVASARKNNNDRIRCIGYSSKRSISHRCALNSSQDKKEIRQNALLSLSLSLHILPSANNPVRRVIECNDDVASVNAALCQVAHDGCKCVTDRCVGAAVTDEAAPSLQFGAIVPSLATKVIGLLSAPGNSMLSRSAASPGVKCRQIMASCKIKQKAGGDKTTK